MDNEFAKTRTGKKFFENDLPMLINAITKMSEALVESNKIEEKKLLLEQKKYLNETRNARTPGNSDDSLIAEQ